MAWHDIALRAQRRILARLGEDVTYTPVTGDPVTVRGAYEVNHQAVDPNTGVPIYSVEKALHVVIDDLPEGSPTPGDQLTRLGQVYQVTGHYPDGDGATVLELRL